MRKGWGGYPRWYLGDLEGGGYPRCQYPWCKNMGFRVGGKEGGKVTRSQPPRGVSGMGQTDCGHPRFVVVVCRYSKTARNGGRVVVF